MRNETMEYIYKTLHKYSSWIIMALTTIVLASSFGIVGFYQISTDIMVRFVCFYSILLTLLWYQAPQYNMIIIAHIIHYLLLILSLNPSFITTNWYIYISWIIFTVDIASAWILYLISERMISAYKYYAIHFFSWLLMFAPLSDDIAVFGIVIGLFLRLLPMVFNFWWKECRDTDQPLSVAMILLGNMSILLDFGRYFLPSRFIGYVREFTFIIPKLDVVGSLPNLTYVIALVVFVYYIFKLLSSRHVKDIMLNISKSQMSLFIVLMVEVMYRPLSGAAWESVLFTNWYGLIIPWAVGVCLTQIGLKYSRHYDPPMKFEIHSDLFYRYWWLYALTLLAVVSYFSSMNIFWFFSFSSILDFIDTDFSKMIMFCVVIIAIFTSIWWAICVRNIFMAVLRLSSSEILQLLLILALFCGILIFQSVIMTNLWNTLPKEENPQLMFAINNLYTYHLQYIYLILIGMGLAILNYLWRVWEFGALMIGYVKCKLMYIFRKIWSFTYKIASRVYVLFIRRLGYMIHDLACRFVRSMVFCVESGGHTSPGSAIFILLIFLLLMLLLSYA